MTAGPGRGSYSIGTEEKKGGGWWKWLLALLLLALVVAALLLLLGIGGDDEDAGDSGATTTTAPTSTGTAASTSAGGTLTASGTSLLGAGGGDALAQSVGDSAKGEAVTVQSVVGDDGFWVGPSEDDRVYVEYGGGTGEDETASRPKVGDTVDLTGPVRPAPEDPAQTLNLEPDDADRVTSQGAYVNAETVEQAG